MSKSEEKLTYVADCARHLICVPYSIENLHRMAEELGIKKCWFHKNHYDIPARRVEEILKKCKVVETRNIVEILQNPQFGETLISPEVNMKGAAIKRDYFLMAQRDYHGYSE